jgi:hypothetical protein
MDDSKIQHAQQQVDEAYGMFVANVARGRGVKAADVRNGFGEGRVVGAKEACASAWRTASPRWTRRSSASPTAVASAAAGGSDACLPSRGFASDAGEMDAAPR